MTLVYGSVCDGIGAASVAWCTLKMRCAWRSEIASFPSAVLAARWPDVPNLGDFTRIGIDHAPPESVDLLVGGTPCQSFSVAGGRAGLDDPRGHLAVEFLLLARRVGARWLVWENVPGVFSVDDGDAFASFVSLATECGYGVAWRVLDAQHFGVPQRRRRVFVVGYLGDWRPPVAVLLERPSMRRDSAKGRRARPASPQGAGGRVDAVGRVVNSLTAHGARQDPSSEPYVVGTLGAHHHRNAPDDPITIAFHATQDPIAGPMSPCLGTEPGCIGIVSDTLRGQGRAPDHGMIVFDEKQITSAENRTHPRNGDPAPTLATQSRVDVIGDARPRRLTPREWERLQGFPDDHTLIEGADDSPRYAALGNSMAVPVMYWIGRRLLMVDRLTKEAA